MFGSTKLIIAKSVLLFAFLLLAIPVAVNANFDEATKAYLLGEFEKARYEALVAATDGNPAAQMLLGQLYFNGEGVEKDIAHALYWYNRSADSGFADAQYRLGILYHDGAPGIQKNLDLAYIYLNQALKSGRKDALEKLEWLHKTDRGIVVNLNDDVEVLKQVASSGNQKARFLLSQKMIKGADVPQDIPAAIKMLRDDAEVGFVKAQKQLGELFFYGNGVEQDYIEAYAWSMAYAGTNKLGGIAREGKQVARSALRKLPEETHQDAYVKSREYFEKFVLPFHKDARPVGPDKYRIVVRSRVKKDEAATRTAKTSAAAQTSTPTQGAAEKLPGVTTQVNKPAATALLSEQAKAENIKSEPETGSEPEKLKPDQSSAVQQPPETARVESTQPARGDSPADTADNGQQAAIQKSDSSTKDNDSTDRGQQTQPLPDPVIDSAASITGPLASREDKEVISSQPVETGDNQDTSESSTATVAERNFEEVYNVLVRKKAALYQIYVREYELNKQLEGRVVFDIVIAADGTISSIEVVSNTVDSPTLEQSLIDYLKANVSFASEQVADFKINYPVDFLPP